MENDDSSILKKFGENLADLRRTRNVSQEGLGALANLDRTYVSSVERGHRNISLLNIIKIAQALNVLPEDLLKNLKFNRNNNIYDSIDNAFFFYKNFIYKKDVINNLKRFNLKVPGCVPPVFWELFGAILTGCHGNGLIGADLRGWEVKSSVFESSFEYQYHLNTGEKKLHEDSMVNHLFCSYSREYESVLVKAIPGTELVKLFFSNWLPEYKKNYNLNVEKSQRRQRFRKSISFKFVQEKGKTILEIKNGILSFKDKKTLDKLNALVVV